MNIAFLSTAQNKARVVIPRWVILVIDQSIVFSSFVLSCLILKLFSVLAVFRGQYLDYILLYQFLSLISFYGMNIHTGLIRYSNMQDMLRIFTTIIICTIAFIIPVEFYWFMIAHKFSLTIMELLLMNFFISSSLLIMLRTGVKEVFNIAKNTINPAKKRVLICGADANAILVKHTLESSNLHYLSVVGFFALGEESSGGFIEQKKIIRLKELPAAKIKLKIDKLLVTSDQLEKQETKKLIEECLRLEISVLKVPASEHWISGKLSLNQINSLKIEDLLQRETIKIENELIRADIEGKRILVTGAAGSIGSEIVRQVLKYNPSQVIVFDQAETPLYNLELELNQKSYGSKVQVCIGDVRKYSRMSQVFEQFKPQIIFHAAAYKHVPMMESNPSEAILTNVMGTKNVADLAVEYSAESFIMISTDKAVNPANIMGASKRMAEIYVQSLHRLSRDNKLVMIHKDEFAAVSFRSKTNFITTRFGNVLGSNGSVIPRFHDQINNGGPITVTHPEITRFFMTIPEAVSLVLEAGIMGNGGEIYVFDMGEPVKIKDLAIRMIELAGLVPNVDITIEYTGLRPGEKLYEELLSDEETTAPTHHPLIKIALVGESSGEAMIDQINSLLTLIISGETDEEYIVRFMKMIVADFISNNSRFEELDKISA